MVSKQIIISLLGVSVAALSGCSVAGGYSESEQEVISELTPSKYQPATRQMRSAVETQDILAQAAFWSREYQLNPADLEAAVKLAAAVRKMGNAGKAVEITQTTRAMYPTDPYLIAEHSASLIALERGSEAIKPLDTALHSAPSYARLWSLKGAALDQMGKYDLARQHYNRALELTPQDPNIMANMGLSFALAGDAATAERWLRQAVNHPDAGPGIRQNLDLVLQLQGKPSLSTPQKPASTALRGQVRSNPQARVLAQPGQQAYTTPAPQAPVIGHRSNMTVVGSQAGAPQNAAQMARAVASNSGQSKVVVPHQAPVAPKTNILDQIARSVNGKRAEATAPRTALPTQHQPGSVYPPNPYSGQARPQAGLQAPAGYPQQQRPQYQPYPAQADQAARRGAARRR